MNPWGRGEVDSEAAGDEGFFAVQAVDLGALVGEGDAVGAGFAGRNGPDGGSR